MTEAERLWPVSAVIAERAENSQKMVGGVPQLVPALYENVGRGVQIATPLARCSAGSRVA